jgi:hypothetical protein
MSGTRSSVALNNPPDLAPSRPHPATQDMMSLLHIELSRIPDASRETVGVRCSREMDLPGHLTRSNFAQLSDRKTVLLTNTIPEPFRDQVGLKSRIHQDG